MVYLYTPAPTAAHTGNVALARPVENIHVDGHFTDWPADFKTYPLTLLWGDRPQNAKDLSAQFRLGYSLEPAALFLAVEVADQSALLDSAGNNHAQDGCRVFIKADHGDSSSIGPSYSLWGDQRASSLGPGALFEVALQRQGDRRHYEWRLPLEAPLETGAVLGLNILLTDQDQDHSYTILAWAEQAFGVGEGSRGPPGGDVVLGAGQNTHLVGQVRWADLAGGIARTPVGFSGPAGHSGVVTTDRQGHFDLLLPAATYQLEALGLGRVQPARATIALVPGRPAEVELVVAGPRGEKVVAGQGRNHRTLLGVLDGLAGPNVTALAQDARGRLWLSSGGGVSRFDGEGFFNLTARDGLPPRLVSQLLVDRHDHLWIGAGPALGRWDGQKIELFARAEGLSGDLNALLEDSRGQLWVATSRGLFVFDGTAFAPFAPVDHPPLAEATALYEDRQGQLWIGTQHSGLYRLTGPRLHQFTAVDGLPSHPIETLLEDQQGQLWIGTKNGLSRFDGEQFVHFTDKDGLPDNHVRALAFDGQGQLWIATWGGGACIWDGKAFVPHVQVFGGETHGFALLADRFGQMWYGHVGGVSRYSGAISKRWTSQDGLPCNSVSYILEDRQGHLWVGSWDCGLYRYDGATFTHYTRLDGLVDNNVHALLEDQQGQLWIGTSNGISRFDGQTFTTYNWYDGQPNGRIASILADRQGHLWFAAGWGGLSRYDGEEFTVYTRADGLPSVRIDALVEDRQGQLWVGTWDGLYRFDGKGFHPVEGLADPRIHAMLGGPDGRLWLGTWGGLSVYDGQQFTHYTDIDGLAHNSILSLAFDRREQLWIGTNGGGVSRFDGQVFQTLTSADGLAGDTPYSILPDRAGNVWLSSPEKGLTRYQPPSTPPSINIEAVVADRRYEGDAVVTLSITSKVVAFEFGGLSLLSDRGALVYYYRLNGLEQAWRTTRQRRVEYTDVPVGNYTFQVKAIDRDLNYSKTAQIQLIARPPYGVWALVGGLGLALVGLVVAGGYGWRRRRERDQVRTLMAREQRRRIEAQQQALPATPPTELNWTLDDFVAQSPAMHRCLNQVHTLQQQPNAGALIVGEPGTGKELIARALHAGSPRREGAFVAIRCAALPQNLQTLDTRTQVQAQLFGHANAFAGAEDERQGLVQQADGGTLFFDEIGLLPLPLQDHLLRVLRQGQVRRLGEDTVCSVDVRVIAASQMDLELQVQLGLFRPEFYQFIAPVKLEVPPLRQRTEDIGVLSRYLVTELAKAAGKEGGEVSETAVARLATYSLPDNVRQLRSLLERAWLASGGQPIGPEHLPAETAG